VARKVTWGGPARDDLFQAAEYIARDSRHYANALLDAAREASRSLAVFPERGRRNPEIGEETVREIFVLGYRLIYEIRADTIDVLAFVHGARDLAAWWEREKSGR
jgi:plasmid stabilization system protein ParE